jgi:hypothetical protein
MAGVRLSCITDPDRCCPGATGEVGDMSARRGEEEEMTVTERAPGRSWAGLLSWLDDSDLWGRGGAAQIKVEDFMDDPSLPRCRAVRREEQGLSAR